MPRADVLLILTIGAVAAFVVRRLLVDPHSRRPQFRGRAFSRTAAAWAAAATFAVFALLAWLNTVLVR